MPSVMTGTAINSRYKNMTNIIYDGNALYRAFCRTRKVCAYKPQMQRFELDFLHQLAVLQQELKSGEYEMMPKTQFVIKERGKTRLIRAAAIRDKIVQHVLCDEVLTPALLPKLIYDNYASLEGRGVAMARKRFKIMLHRYYRKYGTNDGYILLMDFSGFYDNLRHDGVYKAIAKHVKDREVLALLGKAIKSCRQDVSYLADAEIVALYNGRYKALDYADVPNEMKTGSKYLNKGMDIGDQASQIAAIYYPTPVDNFIKIVKGEKYYGRYMDDSFIISGSKEHLKELLLEIKVQTDALGLIFNERKVKIIKLSQTFSFLQNRYTLTETGRVIERINPKRVTAMRRRLKKLAKLQKQGRITKQDIQNCFFSWRGSFYKYMSKAQRRNMDAVYNDLIGGLQT